uniref:Uncharacterized protein n=1 Tax=Arundo donax TaxID=35708 RepID=A0A0A8XTA7_ARUDO
MLVEWMSARCFRMFIFCLSLCISTYGLMYQA